MASILTAFGRPLGSALFPESPHAVEGSPLFMDRAGAPVAYRCEDTLGRTAKRAVRP